MDFFRNKAVIALCLLGLTLGYIMSVGRSLLNYSNDVVASAPQFSPSKGKDMIMKVVDDETANREQKIQDTSAQQPIAWLMTFPNSGTSYTSRLVAK